MAILIQFVTISWCCCKCLRGQRYNLVRTRKCNKHGGSLISWFTWKLPKAKYSNIQPFNDPSAKKAEVYWLFLGFTILNIFCFLRCHSFVPKLLIGIIQSVFILLILREEYPLTQIIYHLRIRSSGKPVSFQTIVRFWIQYQRNECYI